MAIEKDLLEMLDGDKESFRLAYLILKNRGIPDKDINEELKKNNSKYLISETLKGKRIYNLSTNFQNMKMYWSSPD